MRGWKGGLRELRQALQSWALRCMTTQEETSGWAQTRRGITQKTGVSSALTPAVQGTRNSLERNSVIGREVQEYPVIRAPRIPAWPRVPMSCGVQERGVVESHLSLASGSPKGL